MAVYTIQYDDDVIKHDIPKLASSARNLIQKAIQERLTQDPQRFGKPLRYSYKGHRRLRVSDYRVIYRIDEVSHRVFIVAIGHRRDIYDEQT